MTSGVDSALKLKNVQALRGIAAMLVVLFHLGVKDGFERRYIAPDYDLMQPFAAFGSFGVDLFFVISGFIMIVTTWQQFAEPSAGLHFFVRRVIRVYPAYWLLLVPLAFVYAAHPEFVNSHGSKPNVLASFLLLPQAGTPLLLVSWSLVFEMEFYVVFALALLLPRRALPLVIAAWFVVIAAAALVFARVANPYVQQLGDWLAIEFVFGVVVGALTMSGKLRAPVTALAVGAFALLAAFTAAASPLHARFSFWEQLAVITLPCAVLLYGAVGVERLRGWVAPAFLVLLGDASYAIYLWHVPVLSLVGRGVVRLHVHGVAAHVVVDALFITAVVIVGIAVYRYAERPLTHALTRRFNRLARPPRAAVAVATRAPTVTK